MAVLRQIYIFVVVHKADNFTRVSVFFFRDIKHNTTEMSQPVSVSSTPASRRCTLCAMDPIPDGDQVECSVPHCKRALCRGCTQEQQGSPECGPHARRHAAIDGLRAELLRARSYDTKLIQHREIESMMTIFMMGSEDWNRCRNKKSLR